MHTHVDADHNFFLQVCASLCLSVPLCVDADRNFVLQVAGRKRWTLYPTAESAEMHPFPRTHPLWHKAQRSPRSPHPTPRFPVRNVYICIYIRVYIRIYIRVYVYVYVYTYTYTNCTGVVMCLYKCTTVHCSVPHLRTVVHLNSGTSVYCGHTRTLLLCGLDCDCCALILALCCRWLLGLPVLRHPAGR